jgi:hypothetical protein
MIEPATADLIADLLLRYYRNPTRYSTQSPREAHALGHLDVVLRLALGRPVELSDPALREPAVTADLECAAVFLRPEKLLPRRCEPLRYPWPRARCLGRGDTRQFPVVDAVDPSDRHGGDKGVAGGLCHSGRSRIRCSRRRELAPITTGSRRRFMPRSRDAYCGHAGQNACTAADA